MELSVFSAQAVEAWILLRRHASDVDSWAGAYLPIRYEAMHIECGKYAAPEEIFWRVVFLDAEFLKYEEAKRKKQEERKETKRRRK